MTDSLGTALEAIASRLGHDEPIEKVPRETAAVAVIIRSGKVGGEVLLIKRAERAGDPWSGDVAFPGGRIEAEDSSFRDASVREAREEVGVDLETDARFLGYMGPYEARRRNIRVVPSVFLVTGALSVQGNDEVFSHVWVPLQTLLARENRSSHRPESGDDRSSFPSFNLQGLVVWGVTERILTSLLDSVAGGSGRTTSRRTS